MLRLHPTTHWKWWALFSVRVAYFLRKKSIFLHSPTPHRQHSASCTTFLLVRQWSYLVPSAPGRHCICEFLDGRAVCLLQIRQLCRLLRMHGGWQDSQRPSSEIRHQNPAQHARRQNPAQHVRWQLHQQQPKRLPMALLGWIPTRL